MASPAGQVGLLDPEALELRFLDAQPFPVAAAAFSPSGDRLAVVMPRAGVQLIDVETGESIGAPMLGGTFGGRSRPGVRWDDDGRHVWTDPDGVAQRMIADPELWVERACEIVERDLTLEEWQAFVDPDGEPVSACDRDG